MMIMYIKASFKVILLQNCIICSMHECFFNKGLMLIKAFLNNILYSFIAPVFSVTWSSEIIKICWFIISFINSCAAWYIFGTCDNFFQDSLMNKIFKNKIDFVTIYNHSKVWGEFLFKGIIIFIQQWCFKLIKWQESLKAHTHRDEFRARYSLSFNASWLNKGRQCECAHRREKRHA